MNSPAQPSLVRALPPLGNEWSRFGVKRAWLFGSGSTNHVTPESDWDFLVEFSKPPTFDAFMGLRSTLEERLQGRVDLLSRTACAPRFLKAIEAELIDVT
ncbi:MAG: nucleotidyltransferase family protein [Chthoniobacterales bacterium]